MISKNSSKNVHRSTILIYFSIAFVGIIFLAASISKLEFEPGLPFPGSDATTLPLSNSVIDESITSENPGINLVILNFGIGIGFLLLSVMIIYSLARKTNKRNIGKLILGLIGIIIIFYVLQHFHSETSISFDTVQEGSIQLPTLDNEIVPIEQPPSQLYWMVGIGLLVGFISVCAFLLLRNDPKPMDNDAIVEELNFALKAIQDGKDLRNIIINCYLQLNQIIKHEFEIEREKSITAREFEFYLKGKGIPMQPIHQMTSVFEKVRYSNKPTSEEDEQIVIASLEEIRSSCQKKRSFIE